VLVRTGWLAERQSFLPLHDALEVDGELRMPYRMALVRQAPTFEPGDELTADDERILTGHYGLHDLRGSVAEPRAQALPDAQSDLGAAVDWEALSPAGTEQPSADAPRGSESSQVSDEGRVEVTRSEEELRVGVRTRLRRVRLRKYLVTEYVTRTIPIRREEVRLEQIPSGLPVTEETPPAAEAGRAGGGAEPLPELILHREEPVIQMQVVPVERVRVVKHLVREERTVTEQVRKERVEVQQDPVDPTS
jgi:stress response protein YsnF